MTKRTIIYGGRRPPGWVLAHNCVRRTVKTKHGENGFRRFWVPPAEKWKVCRCGWRPDLGVHHAIDPD